MTLEDYTAKRHFGRTPEPPAATSVKGELLTFVVHKHAARNLHYDLRLELDGVLKSWAITKGPSLNPAVKRLAVMVEDHPFSYGSFEGVIPKGEYGAGEVIVWDRGTYAPDKDGVYLELSRAEAEQNLRRGLAGGKLSVTLYGQKLKGSWTLVRMGQSQNNWLLIKHSDNSASTDADILEQDRSVQSGSTVEQLHKANPPPAAGLPAFAPGAITGAHPAAMPRWIPPMLAQLVAKPFSGTDWIFEPKLDGYRALAFIQGTEAALRSRNNSDLTAFFPVIADELKSQGLAEAVLDGEIIAIGPDAKPCFGCLQQHQQILHGTISSNYALQYYIFDIIYLNGYSLLDAPWSERNALLKRIIRPSEHVLLVDHFEGGGEQIFQASVEAGFEGVVAKRKTGVYEPGKRSGAWLKVKATRSDEFVVGGYTAGGGRRSDVFGSLLIGYYDFHDHLLYAGNVGSGFSEELLVDLKVKLDSLKTGASPFTGELPRAMPPITWVRPELVAEVKYAGITTGGLLRVPIFLRLRDDKSPSEIVRQRLGVTT